MTLEAGTKFYVRNDGLFTYRQPSEGHFNPPPETYRPLVVIDPEDEGQIERLIDALANAERDKGRDYTEERSGVMEAALREFANPNPKPEEPLSPGAIVKDADGVRWVSWRKEGMAHHERPWQRLELDTDEQRDYRNISAVAVLFNGDPAE